MTQTINRPPDQTSGRGKAVPSHPHYALGTLITLGIVGTLVAIGVAVAALMITAGRNAVDDGLVSERVDSYLAEAAIPVGAGGEVIPVLVPKADLPLAPKDEVNLATAPAMPPASGRTTPAMVGVQFEVVEGPSTIVLVDHALARAFDKGAVGQIVVTGAENPEIFEEVDAGAAPTAPSDQGAHGATGEESVSILAGSFEAQPMDAADEFAESESLADYSVNVLTVKVGTTITWVNDDSGMMHTVTGCRRLVRLRLSGRGRVVVAHIRRGRGVRILLPATPMDAGQGGGRTLTDAGGVRADHCE